MTFSSPLALILLICIPVIIYIGWPRQTYRRARDIASLMLRTLIALLLVLALAGTQVTQSADKLAVVFLLDASDSMSANTQEASLDYIREATNTMQPDDEVGIIVFGANALIERPLSNVRDIGNLQSSPASGNTNLERAIRLALGMLPADAARRIVILSDGETTLGNAQAAAELAAASGVEISYVSYTSADSPEVQVSNVTTPNAINSGQNFDLSFSVQAEAPTPARISIFDSGQIIYQEVVDLRAGTNSYTLSLQGAGSGFKDFQVQVDPLENDNFFQNNQLSTFSRVIGPPRVLLVYSSEEEIQYLRSALEQAGLTVDTTTPDQLPFTLVPLAQYESIILANVPATRMTPTRMETLQRYVRDLGGGLVVVGGPQTYGPGGYFQTPLEETLPLESQITDQLRLPQLTIAYLIDRSGSMGAVGPSGVENIELAKEAIIRSIDLLQPTDRAGVVSFDSVGYWIARIQDVRDRIALQRLVGTLRASGGTDILAGMNLVATDIAPDPSARKHIILLTDGGADAAGLVDLSRRLNEESGVTTSVIAIGGGAASFLGQMANVGGGNYHIVTAVEQIPTIFTQETVLATRSYIIENTFFPTISSNSPIMRGINASPALLGYVATTAKQTAEVILRGPAPYNDPLLAAWQYGLGRSVAFTSDATSRWGAAWVSWDAFVRFWDQAVRWTITEGTTNNLETRVVMEGEQARLIVDARDNDGAFLNGLDLQLSVINPEAQPTLLDLQQVAPGRYEATFSSNMEGAYLLAVRSTDDEQATINQTTGWVMSYSAEYDRNNRGDGNALLADLATLTGGQSLKDTPEGVFAHNLSAVAAGTPIWQVLLLSALILLPFDIAVRRLIVTRGDLQRLREFIFRENQAVTSSERMTTLMDAKQRGRQRAEEISSSGTVSNLQARKEQARENLATSSSELKPAPAPVDEQPASPPANTQATEDGNVAGALLKKRRERSDK